MISVFEEINNISDADAATLTDGSVADGLHDHLFSGLTGEISDAQHGDRAGGSLHADATPSVDGFMSAVDKTKLDTVETDAKDDQTGAEIEAIVSHDNLLDYFIDQHRIINDSGTATNELWSASKVDSEITASKEGRTFKGGVLTDSDGLGNITLSAEQTLNGELTSSDIVLLVEQTAPSENGPWITDAGPWTRPANFNAPGEATNGATWHVTGPSSTSLTFQWTLITQGTITIDVTPLAFTNDGVFELGDGAGQAIEGTNPRMLSQDENDACLGTDGTPSNTNRFVPNSDPRLHSHANQAFLDVIDQNLDKTSTPELEGLTFNDDSGDPTVLERTLSFNLPGPNGDRVKLGSATWEQFTGVKCDVVIMLNGGNSLGISSYTVMDSRGNAPMFGGHSNPVKILPDIFLANGVQAYSLEADFGNNDMTIYLRKLEGIGNAQPTTMAIRLTGKNVTWTPDGSTVTSVGDPVDITRTSKVSVDTFLNELILGGESGGVRLTAPIVGDLEVTGDILNEGIGWTSRTSAVDNNWRALAYGHGIYVAIAEDGTGDRVMTSTDGRNWTAQTSAADSIWTGVTFGNGLFVAVSFDGGTQQVMTSPDGKVWTLRDTPNDQGWIDVTYGNGLFVAVSFDGPVASRAMTSPDGIVWTTQTTVSNGSPAWYSIAYGDNLFIAVAFSGGSGRMMSSPDAITWTERADVQKQFRDVVYGNGVYVAVGDGSGTDQLASSNDGLSWTLRNSSVGNGWFSVAYGDGLFVAVANTGTGDRVMTSPDGINWTTRTSAADNGWKAIIFENGQFVAVADTGVDIRVMTSGSPEKHIFSSDNLFLGPTEFKAQRKIINGAFRIEDVFEEAHFGVDSGGEILLDSLTFYNVIGTVAHANTLVSPAGGITAVGSLIPMIAGVGTPVTGNALICTAPSDKVFKAQGDSMNNGTLSVFNLQIITTTDTMTVFSMKDTEARSNILLLGNLLVSGGRLFDTDNVSIAGVGVIGHFEPTLSLKVNQSDTTPSENQTFDLIKLDIFKETAAIPSLDYIEVLGDWHSFAINSGIIEVVKADEAAFNIDSGSSFDTFNVRGINADLEGGVAFRSGSLDQKTLIFSGNIGIPNSTVSAELFLNDGDGTTLIPAVGALVEINRGTKSWTSDVVERITANIDGSVQYTDINPVVLKVDGNINVEPASSTKNISIRTVLISPPSRTVTFTNGTNIINETATPRNGGDLISFRETAGTLPAEIRKDVVYYVVNKNVNDFQISYTLGGAAITFTDDGTPTNSYQVAKLHGSKPTNAIASNNPRDLIPQATTPAINNSKIYFVVTNDDDATDIEVKTGYGRYVL